MLRIRVPRAARQQRPVHVGSNPFGGTYLRRYEGDYTADDEAVRRLFYGDHAGSGLPKIYTNWAGQHWRRPVLYELVEPEQTLMELRMSSLVPEQAVAELQAHLGPRFRVLPEQARLALIAASTKGSVNHARLREISSEHPADITKMLAGLVREGLLVSDGAGRGMVYFLPWHKQSVGLVFDSGDPPSPRVPDALPPELSDQPPELRTLCLDWGSLSPALQAALVDLALPVSERSRVLPWVLQETVLHLCSGRYLGLRVLAHVLQRDSDDLRKRTLIPMVKAGALKTAFAAPNDPRQAYTAASDNPTNTP